jgi:hypothetical protein
VVVLETLDAHAAWLPLPRIGSAEYVMRNAEVKVPRNRLSGRKYHPRSSVIFSDTFRQAAVCLAFSQKKNGPLARRAVGVFRNCTPEPRPTRKSVVQGSETRLELQIGRS